MAVPTETFLVIFSVIIFIGFAGSWLLSKKGIPQTLFLIAAGIFTRWLGILPASSINALLPLFSEVTLVMVVFDLGMSMKIREAMTEGRSAVERSSLYMFLSILLVALVFIEGFHWGVYQALLLGAVIGGDVTMVVVPYLAKRTSRTYLISSLAIESVYDSMVLIIFFFVLLSGYSHQTALDLQGIAFITSQFFVQLVLGVAGGLLFGFAWLRTEKHFGHYDYFYLATVGYILLTYVLVNEAGGSGIITVLTVGLMLRNTLKLPRLTGRSEPLSAVSLNYLSAFQGEISFFLSSFFLFFLGFSVQESNLLSSGTYLPAAAVVGILVVTRVVSTEIVDRGKGRKDRWFIEAMMAEGLTPALLATTLVADSVVGSADIFTITTLVIVATNIIAAAGVYFAVKGEQGLGLESLRSAAPLVKELGAMATGLEPDTMDSWRKRIVADAREYAPPEAREKISLTGGYRGSDPSEPKELKISREAVPYILRAIDKNRSSMPEGARTYFETLEALIAKGVRDRRKE